MQKTMNTYKTSDLYLSAYLKAMGFHLRDKQREGQRFFFVFDDREDRKRLIESYFNDGMVNINHFKNALQDLKTMVFNV